jgi:ribonuclease HII
MFELDRSFSGPGIAGTDEAGRGPLCGPVCAAAVMLRPGVKLPGLNDSKKLTANRRDVLFDEIREQSLCWAIAWSTVAEIDRLNILQASHLAMCRAVAALSHEPQRILVDGDQLPRCLRLPATALVRGDQRHSAIAAASILAKVARDRYMLALHRSYPQFELDRNKGYPTAQHLKVLRQCGPCPEHRQSFAPVRDSQTHSVLEQKKLEF